MFKRTQHFEIISIQNNRQYNNERNLLRFGYSYSYIPANVFLKILSDAVQEYNTKFPTPKLDFVILAQLDKEHAQFSLKGQKKHIDDFMNGILTTEDILMHWSISRISKYSVVL